MSKKELKPLKNKPFRLPKHPWREPHLLLYCQMKEVPVFVREPEPFAEVKKPMPAKVEAAQTEPFTWVDGISITGIILLILLAIAQLLGWV